MYPAGAFGDDALKIQMWIVCEMIPEISKDQCIFLEFIMTVRFVPFSFGDFLLKPF